MNNSSNGIKIFESEQFGQIRTVVRDGEPWFVAADVCKALGVRNNRDAISRLYADQTDVGVADTSIGKRNVTIISEPGLYHLMFNATPTNARNVSAEEIKKKQELIDSFRRWITHEVIPSIRKHGMYATEATIDSILMNPEFGIRLLIELKEEREKSRKLQEDVANRDAYIDAIEPKADYCQKILEAPEALAVTVIAKDYGMTAQRFNKLLHDKHVQYKCNGEWVLYKEYADKGYTKSFTFFDDGGYVRVMNKWTQSGRMFLYHLLKDEGIMPVVA